MKLDDMYPSRWLKATDVARPVLATIKSIGVEDIGDDEQKPVMHFAGTLKPLIVNRTNALTISQLYGEDTAGWLGKPIVLFSAKVQFQSRLVDAIRVREPKQQATNYLPQVPHVPAPPPFVTQPPQPGSPLSPAQNDDGECPF
jgi:hypothetical protein